MRKPVVHAAGFYVLDYKVVLVKETRAREEEMSFNNNGNEPVSLYVVLSKIPSENYAKNI